MCYDYEKQEFSFYDTNTNEITFLPEDLQENKKWNKKSKLH